MSKLSNLDGQSQAFKLYCAGMSCADIARTLNVVPNTVTNWKAKGKWDEDKPANGAQLPAVTPPTDKSDDIMTEIKVKVHQALQNENIKPTKWKDIIDTLYILTRDAAPASRRAKREEIDVTDLDDKDLDKEIEELQRLSKDKTVEDAEIVLGEDDVLEIVS